jgi:hypothetical protein
VSERVAHFWRGYKSVVMAELVVAFCYHCCNHLLVDSCILCQLKLLWNWNGECTNTLLKNLEWLHSVVWVVNIKIGVPSTQLMYYIT